MQPHVSHHMQSAAVSVRGVPVQAWTSRRARRRRPAARAARGSARSAPRCQTSAGAARPRPSAAPPPRASAPAWWAAPRPTAPPALLRADPRSSPAGLQAIPPSQVFHLRTLKQQSGWQRLLRLGQGRIARQQACSPGAHGPFFAVLDDRKAVSPDASTRVINFL